MIWDIPLVILHSYWTWPFRIDIPWFPTVLLVYQSCCWLNANALIGTRSRWRWARTLPSMGTASSSDRSTSDGWVRWDVAKDPSVHISSRPNRPNPLSSGRADAVDFPGSCTFLGETQKNENSQGLLDNSSTSKRVAIGEVLLSIDSSTCMLQVLTNIFKHLKDATAGRCGCELKFGSKISQCIRGP